MSKITGIVIDIVAIIIWALGTYKLHKGEISFVWEGISYYAAGLVVFVVEDSHINIAVKKVITTLIGRLGHKE